MQILLFSNSSWTQDKLEFKQNLMQSIRGCLTPYEVDEKVFKDGFEKAFDFAYKDIDNLRPIKSDVSGNFIVPCIVP